jgi:hypothetical protein
MEATAARSDQLARQLSDAHVDVTRLRAEGVCTERECVRLRVCGVYE